MGHTVLLILRKTLIVKYVVYTKLSYSLLSQCGIIIPILRVYSVQLAVCLH